MLYIDADIHTPGVNLNAEDRYFRAIYNENYLQYGSFSERELLAVADYADHLLTQGGISLNYLRRNNAKKTLAETPSKLEEIQKKIKRSENFQGYVRKQMIDLNEEGRNVLKNLFDKGIINQHEPNEITLLAILNLPDNKKAKRIPFFRKGLSGKEYKGVNDYREKIHRFMKNRGVDQEDILWILKAPWNEGRVALPFHVETKILKKVTSGDFKSYLRDLRLEEELSQKNISYANKNIGIKLEIPAGLEKSFRDFVSTITEDDLICLSEDNRNALDEVMERHGFSFPSAQKRKENLDILNQEYREHLYSQSPWLAVTEKLPPLSPGCRRMYHGASSPVIMNNKTALTKDGDDGVGFYTAKNGERSMGYVRATHNELSAERFEIIGGYLHVLTLNFDERSCLKGGVASDKQREAVSGVLEKKYGYTLEELKKRPPPQEIGKQETSGVNKPGAFVGVLAKYLGLEEAINVLHEAGIKGNVGDSYHDIIVFKPDNDVTVEETIQVKRPLSPEAIVQLELMKAKKDLSSVDGFNFYAENPDKDRLYVELVNEHKSQPYYKKEMKDLSPEEFKKIYMAAWNFAGHGISLPEQMAHDLEEAANRKSTADLETTKVLKSSNDQSVSLVVDKDGRKWSKRQPYIALDDSGRVPQHMAARLKERQLHYGREKAANDIYRLCGVNVPETFIGRDGSLYREFIDGRFPSAEEVLYVQEQVRKHVAVDILVDNWDLTSNDNVIFGKDGRAWRMDNGSAFDFTGGNQQKSRSGLADPSEALQRLGRKGKHFMAVDVYGGVTDKELATQIQQLASKKKDILALVPKDIKNVIEKRFDAMQNWSVAVLTADNKNGIRGSKPRSLSPV